MVLLVRSRIRTSSSGRARCHGFPSHAKRDALTDSTCRIASCLLSVPRAARVEAHGTLRKRRQRNGFEPRSIARAWELDALRRKHSQQEDEGVQACDPPFSRYLLARFTFRENSSSCSLGRGKPGARRRRQEAQALASPLPSFLGSDAVIHLLHPLDIPRETRKASDSCSDVVASAPNSSLRFTPSSPQTAGRSRRRCRSVNAQRTEIRSTLELPWILLLDPSSKRCKRAWMVDSISSSFRFANARVKIGIRRTTLTTKPGGRAW